MNDKIKEIVGERLLALLESTDAEGVPNLAWSTASDLVKDKVTFEALANYCELRLAAMDARFDGDIEEATRIERTMERVYKRLPGWARW